MMAVAEAIVNRAYFQKLTGNLWVLPSLPVRAESEGCGCGCGCGCACSCSCGCSTLTGNPGDDTIGDEGFGLGDDGVYGTDDDTLSVQGDVSFNNNVSINGDFSLDGEALDSIGISSISVTTAGTTTQSFDGTNNSASFSFSDNASVSVSYSNGETTSFDVGAGQSLSVGPSVGAGTPGS